MTHGFLPIEKATDAVWPAIEFLKGADTFVEKFKEKFSRDVPQTKKELESLFQELDKEQGNALVHFTAKESHKFQATYREVERQQSGG